MNYRELLKKYMAHILEEEGKTYTDRLSSEDFTQEEIREIQTIAEQL